MSWDMLITFIIIAFACVYLVCKFTGKNKTGSCGCATEATCCGSSGHGSQSGCQGQHRQR